MIEVSRNGLLYLIKFVITALKDIEICTAMRLAFDLCLIACISVTSGHLYWCLKILNLPTITLYLTTLFKTISCERTVIR